MNHSGKSLKIDNVITHGLPYFAKRNRKKRNENLYFAKRKSVTLFDILAASEQKIRKIRMARVQ